jgi:hypothetical protein
VSSNVGRSKKTFSDIDADGSADGVYIARDPGGDDGCKAFVVAATRSGKLVAAVQDDVVAYELGLPLIGSVVQVDEDPGAEIVVLITAGASTQFYGVFTERNGELVRVGLEAEPQGAGALFGYGGSAGHIEGVDCLGAGRVVVTTAVPEGGRYVLTRRIFSASGEAWALHSVDRRKLKARAFHTVPELATGAFSSCPL